MQVGQVHVAISVSDEVPLGHKLRADFFSNGKLGRKLILRGNKLLANLLAQEGRGNGWEEDIVG